MPQKNLLFYPNCCSSFSRVLEQCNLSANWKAFLKLATLLETELGCKTRFKFTSIDVEYNENNYQKHEKLNRVF